MKVQQKLAMRLLQSRIALLSLLSPQKAANTAFNIFCTTTGNRNYALNDSMKQAEALSFIFEKAKMKGFCWNKGKAKKLLIVHGFSSNVSNFTHFIPAFIHKEYEVVAFDSPAHGLSEGKRTHALEYKNFLLEVIKRYGPFDSYLAHSFGGLAICMALAEMPSRSPKPAVVLIAPASSTVTLLQQYFQLLKITNKKVQELFYIKIKDISGKDADWFSIQRCLPHLNASVLWIHDTEDTITPVADALAIQQLHPPHVQFRFTKGLGHKRIYKEEEIVKAVAAFL